MATYTFTASATNIIATAMATNTFSPTVANTKISIIPSSSSFPATGILDAFNRNNGTIGSNWSFDRSGFKIIGNQMGVTSRGMVFWNPTSFGADQEAYVTFVNVDTSATNMDLLLKSQNSDRKTSFLEVMYNPAKKVITIESYTSGKGYVQCGAKIPVTFSNGDQLGARATADGKIYVYKNGTSLAVCDVTAWPDYARGGYVGLLVWGNFNASNVILDDFGGGSIVGSATQIPSATSVSLPTRTNANTPVATVTQTSVPTAKATNTIMPTATNTPTAMATYTFTPSGTNTNPPTATGLRTSTPTVTVASTSTPDPSTLTPTITNTPIVTANNTQTATATFVPIVNPVPFSFVSMGDAQAETANFTLTVNQIKTLNPNIVLFNGDLENDGVWSSELNPMIAALKNAGIYDQTFMVRGNHDDHASGSLALWEMYFETAPNIRVLPVGVTNYVSLNSSSDTLNYSFVYGNAMFIGLDVPGDVDLLTSEKINFLDARLTYAESRGLVHAFIYFHGPLYCVESTHCGCSTRTDSSCTPSSLVSVINKHPIVSATFHGHEHIMGWTHMDNTRVAGLTGSFEEFLTSPSGGWTYNSYLYPARLDYTYMNMGSSQAFAAISVNGSTFTVNFYKVGTTAPVWTMTFTKGVHVSVSTLAPTLGPSSTQTPSITRIPSSTRTPTPVITGIMVSEPTPIVIPSITNTPIATYTPFWTQTPSFTQTPLSVITGTSVSMPTNTVIPSITNTPVASNTPTWTPTPSRTQTPSSNPTTINTSLPAFLGAEGFGAVSIGGRGGKVYEVTNTNDSGAGSLRECVSASGARICVFKVGGTITLSSALSITNPYITIAGQTAPGGGITLKSLGSDIFSPRTHDIIIRYITGRPGVGGENHAAQIASNNSTSIYNIIFDHCSFSWGIDSVWETWYRVYNTTIQWSFVNEGLDCSTHSKGCHSKGLMIGGYQLGESNTAKGSYNISVLHNLMAHDAERAPLMQFCGTGQVINNVTYNPMWTFSHQEINCSDATAISIVNWIGNYHKRGPDSTSNTDLKVSITGGTSTGRAYVQGNIGPSRPNNTLPELNWVSAPASLISTTPAIAPAVTTTDAFVAYNMVLAEGGNNRGLNCDGTWFYRRDSIDTRVVNEVMTGTGHIIDNPSEVGGWVFIEPGTSCTDADHDGMPDVWELAHGLNPTNAADGSQISSSGYTNLEEFLNGPR
jgi:hypothetical protein